MRDGPFEGLRAPMVRGDDRGATARAERRVWEKRSRRAIGSLLSVNRGTGRLVVRLLVLVLMVSSRVEERRRVRGSGLRGRRSSGARKWGRLGSRDLGD